MDISQYTAQTLLGLRNAPLDSVPPIAPKPPQDQHGAQTTSDPGGLFDSVLDAVNPLQHIPGVGSVYRAVTDDNLNPLSSMAGGFLFGGPVGLAAGAAGSFLEMLTGKSLMGHAMALFSGEDGAVPGDGAGHVQTAAAGGDPLLKADQGIGLQHYQSFAKAAGAVHQGVGAKATDVRWAENVWTQQALKEATGTYETNQNLGGTKTDRTERIV